MTDDATPTGGDPTPANEPGHDDSGWQEPASQGSKGREWATQLQTMIEQLATQAAPVVREVGAKAAELAALAGEKAGPAAHRAAQLTNEAGLKLAEKSRTFAAEIRRDQAARGESGSASSAPDETAAAPEAPADATDDSTTTGLG
jgi:hypothetical protein